MTSLTKNVNNKDDPYVYTGGNYFRRQRSLFSYFVTSIIVIVVVLLLAFTILASIKPCLMTNCHKLASKCVNHFPFYAQCICDEGYAGNGRTRCDSCGLSYVRPNIMRIVGGSYARESSWPYAVFIRQFYQGRFRINGRVFIVRTGWRCGGTLINHKTILTASHCIHDRYFNYRHIDKRVYTLKMHWNQWFPNLESTLNVYVGAHDLRNLRFAQKVRVKRIIKNEEFDAFHMRNDFALLKLDRLVEPSPQVQFACLPQNVSNNFPKPNTNAFIVGWGKLHKRGPLSMYLKNSKVKIFNGSTCSSVEKRISKNWNSQICAGVLDGSTDSCQGDSGNGLFVNDYVNHPKYGRSSRVFVAGIVSYGEGCAKVGKPGIYTRVSYWLDWIKRYSDF